MMGAAVMMGPLLVVGAATQVVAAGLGAHETSHPFSQIHCL